MIAIYELHITFSDHVGVKFRQVTSDKRNDDKRRKDGLNTDRNMAYSAKRETTVFETKTRDVCKRPPSPPPLRRAISKNDLLYMIMV